MLDRLIQWLMKLVPEVPEEIAVCEFDCRKPDCLMGHWERCERRRAATPELRGQRTH